MNDADFYESKFKMVDFDHCELDKANYANTSLTGINLSNSKFENLVVSLDTIEGCLIISWFVLKPSSRRESLNNVELC